MSSEQRATLYLEDLQEELRRGARFVIYYYCITLFFWSWKKPSRVLLLRPGYNDRWEGLPVSILGHHPFWRGVPYSLISLLFGGPLVALGSLTLCWYLLWWDLLHEQELNVLIVLPVFVLTFWGLPWGYIYLFSCLLRNTLGGQDVTEEIASKLGLTATSVEPDTAHPLDAIIEGKRPT